MTLEQDFQRRSGVFIVNIKQTSNIALVPLLLTLNKKIPIKAVQK